MELWHESEHACAEPSDNGESRSTISLRCASRARSNVETRTAAALLRRVSDNRGLTRPELSVLLSLTKISLKDATVGLPPSLLALALSWSALSGVPFTILGCSMPAL